MAKSRFLATSVVNVLTGFPLSWISVYEPQKSWPIYAVAVARLVLIWVAIGLAVWKFTLSAVIVGAVALFVYVVECILWTKAEKSGHIIVSSETAFLLALDPLNYLLDTGGIGPTSAAVVVHVVIIVLRSLSIFTVWVVIKAYPRYVQCWSCYTHTPISEYNFGYCPKCEEQQGLEDPQFNWVCTKARYENDKGCLDEDETPSWSNYPSVVHYILLVLSIDLAAYAFVSLIRTAGPRKNHNVVDENRHTLE